MTKQCSYTQTEAATAATYLSLIKLWSVFSTNVNIEIEIPP